MLVRCLLCKYRKVCHASMKAKEKDLKDIQKRIVDSIDEVYHLRREITRLQERRDRLYEELENEE